MKILLVDDKAESLLIMQELLKSRGFDTLQAENGAEGLKLAHSQHPEMIISDIQMPEMDGFELCKRIKSDPELKDIIFVFYSAIFLDQEDERLALDLGATRFIPKPSINDEFIAIIESVIEQQRSDLLPVRDQIIDSADTLEIRHQKLLNDKLHLKIQELQSSRQSFDTLVGNLPGMVYRCINDEYWTMEYISDSCQQVTGYSAQDLIGNHTLPYAQLIHEDDRERVFQEVQAACAEGDIFMIEYRLKHRDGNVIWVWEQGRCINAGEVNEQIEGYIADITHRIEDEKRLELLNRSLLTLSTGNRVVVHASDEMELLTQMCQVVVKQGGYHMAWIGYAEQNETRDIKPMASAGIHGGFLQKLNFSWDDNEQGQGPCSRSIRSGKTQVVQDIQRDAKLNSLLEEEIKRGIASVITLPLKNSSGTFGMIAIYGNKVNPFISEEILLLEELAGDLSYGIISLRNSAEKKLTKSLLDESLLQIIQAFAVTVEKRDPYTAGHQIRVSQLATAIAQQMQLPEHQINGVRLGAMIHDIGKIYIPAEILNRPGRLSEFEFELVKSHPHVGYDIVKDIKFPWPIADMIHQHHERLDGSGYPLGLTAHVICMEARIMAVADVVEAISSHRPYRPALGIEAGIDVIVKGSGVTFDPLVVAACVELFKTENFTFKLT